MAKVRTRRPAAGRSELPPSEAPAKVQQVRVVTDKERSLGFLPMLIMTLIYVVCVAFTDEIGPITSAPGMFRLGADPPLRGCVMPRASP
jgi:hypothetical protein